MDNSAVLTLANAGIFSNGGVLVGSHAFGVILNNLGMRVAENYRTEDIDIGARSAGSIALAIEETRTFIEVLKSTGLPFFEVPELDVRKPPTSFKVRGERLTVDLLVPGTEEQKIRAVPGLRAHATGLPNVMH